MYKNICLNGNIKNFFLLRTCESLSYFFSQNQENRKFDDRPLSPYGVEQAKILGSLLKNKLRSEYITIWRSKDLISIQTTAQIVKNFTRSSVVEKNFLAVDRESYSFDKIKSKQDLVFDSLEQEIYSSREMNLVILAPIDLVFYFIPERLGFGKIKSITTPEGNEKVVRERFFCNAGEGIFYSELNFEKFILPEI